MFNPDLTPGSLGLGVYADLAREVEDLGHRFTMLTIGSQSAQPDRRGELRALAASPMWRTVGAAAAPLVRTRGLLPAAAGLATYLRRDGRSIDLLHVESAYPHGAAAALAIRASGWLGPLVVTPMGEDTLVLERARYGFRRHLVPRRLVDWTLRRTACVRCISPMLEARDRRYRSRHTPSCRAVERVGRGLRGGGGIHNDPCRKTPGGPPSARQRIWDRRAANGHRAGSAPSLQGDRDVGQSDVSHRERDAVDRRPVTTRRTAGRYRHALAGVGPGDRCGRSRPVGRAGSASTRARRARRRRRGRRPVAPGIAQLRSASRRQGSGHRLS